MTPSDLFRSVSVLLLLAFVGQARAADVDEAGARVLFAEGRKLAAAGDYAAACPKFEASLKLDPGIGTNFNLADCLEHVGRTASAWARFLDVAAATRAVAQPERERVARARAAALEPTLTKLVVTPEKPAAGLSVAYDGIAIDQASWGISIPIDPGDHILTATAPHKQLWSRHVAAPAAAGVVTVSIPALAEAPVVVAAAAAPHAPVLLSLPAAPPAPSQRWSLPSIALLSLGGVALATSAVFAFEFQTENSGAKVLCSMNVCATDDEKRRHDVQVADARRYRTAAIGSAVVAGISLLAGAYLRWRW
jgi:hypothetical protein